MPGTQQSFIEGVAAAAKAARQATGVPVSVTVAQAILESNWGRSQLSAEANNYFGIKAFGGLGSDGAVWMPTMEYDSAGDAYTTLDPFRAYKTLADSVLDHDSLFIRLSRYAPAMAVKDDPKAFAVAIMDGGYSTDPSYANKLVSLMDRYDLYRFDG